jgi:putative ABC transport system permease protein
VALLNIGENAAAESARQFTSLGTNILVVQEGRLVNRGHHGIAFADIEKIRSATGAVSLISPISTSTASARFGSRPSDISVIGVTPEILSLANLHLLKGRFLSDLDGSEPFIVIGAGLKKKLADAGTYVQVGTKIRIDNYLLTVVGILDNSLRNPMIPVDFDESVLLPIKSMHRILASDGRITNVLIRVSDGADPASTGDFVKSTLARRENASGIQIQSAKQLIDALNKQNQLFTFLLVGIGAISLLVGGIGVMNVMVASVSERKREIGVRMAMGARKKDVLVMMLFEASGISVVGGLVGVVLGVTIAYLLSLFAGWSFRFFLYPVPVGIGMSLLIGLFFGLYPAYRASKLFPIEALRSE